VESHISALELMTEQTNRMIQDMMIMMQSFTKLEEKNGPSGKQQQTKEVVMTTDQYNAKTLHDEEQE
jgi:hypothetical protein